MKFDIAALTFAFTVFTASAQMIPAPVPVPVPVPIGIPTVIPYYEASNCNDDTEKGTVNVFSCNATLSCAILDQPALSLDYKGDLNNNYECKGWTNSMDCNDLTGEGADVIANRDGCTPNMNAQSFMCAPKPCP
jgi:hypothetical protein